MKKDIMSIRNDFVNYKLAKQDYITSISDLGLVSADSLILGAVSISNRAEILEHPVLYISVVTILGGVTVFLGNSFLKKRKKYKICRDELNKYDFTTIQDTSELNNEVNIVLDLFKSDSPLSGKKIIVPGALFSIIPIMYILTKNYMSALVWGLFGVNKTVNSISRSIASDDTKKLLLSLKENGKVL